MNDKKTVPARGFAGKLTDADFKKIGDSILKDQELSRARYSKLKQSDLLHDKLKELNASRTVDTSNDV